MKASLKILITLLAGLCSSLLSASQQGFDESKLQNILQQQDDTVKARYQYRNPLETLRFFGLKPGMTVVEALPGGGWYTKIIAPYLGKNGHIIAGDYPVDIWKNFEWADDAFIQKRLKATINFPNKVREWSPTETPKASAYNLGAIPDSLNGSVDSVLFIRALHNLSRFNKEHQFLDNSLKDIYRILKPGGTVGIVQHQTALTHADGSQGYLNRDMLVNTMQKAGFKLVAESDINNNPKDQPTAEEYVWRLPPSLNVPEGENNEALKHKYQAIGESNRMTLLFQKS